MPLMWRKSGFRMCRKRQLDWIGNSDLRNRSLPVLENLSRNSIFMWPIFDAVGPYLALRVKLKLLSG